MSLKVISEPSGHWNIRKEQNSTTPKHFTLWSGTGGAKFWSNRLTSNAPYLYSKLRRPSFLADCCCCCFCCLSMRVEQKEVGLFRVVRILQLDYFLFSGCWICNTTSISLSVPLSFTHTHSHTLTLTRTRTHTHTHTRTHSLTHALNRLSHFDVVDTKTCEILGLKWGLRATMRERKSDWVWACVREWVFACMRLVRERERESEWESEIQSFDTVHRSKRCWILYMRTSIFLSPHSFLTAFPLEGRV